MSWGGSFSSSATELHGEETNVLFMAITRQNKISMMMDYENVTLVPSLSDYTTQFFKWFRI